MFIFEKLEVYQRAVDSAEKASNLTAEFPRGSGYLADQLNRASLSISLNIAEGNGRWSKAERRNFFTIARPSVHECIPILELCLRKQLIGGQCAQQLKDELEILAKMLSGLIERQSSLKAE